MKNNLKQFRKEARLSLREMVKHGVCGLTNLHQLEKDASNPTLITAYKIATVLNKTVYQIWPDTTEFVEETITVRRVKVDPHLPRGE